MKIGVISDTHGYLDDQMLNYFAEVDEIWHAGDFGNWEVVEKLKNFKPLIGVFGNIDGHEIRQSFPEQLHIEREGLQIWIIHIGGSPPGYNAKVKKILQQKVPDIMVCGHSHILKVMADASHNKMLYINPGAAGKQGFHKMRTMLRFEIVKRRPTNLEVIELGKRGELP
jgi:uncharacterized protein